MTHEKERYLTIAEILTESERYIGHVIKLKGLFEGWQVLQCQFPTEVANTPRTRGDWLIRTGVDCIYVTGGIPKDINPMKLDYPDISIELEAEVMQDKNGKLYLVYRNSRVL